jgi:hypothetical protein
MPTAWEPITGRSQTSTDAVPRGRCVHHILPKLEFRPTVLRRSRAKGGKMACGRPDWGLV